MRPLAAHCPLALGALYRKAGRPTDARVELVAANELLRGMGMTFWLLVAEAELQLLALTP